MKYVIDLNTALEFPELLLRNDLVIITDTLRELERINSQECFSNAGLKERIKFLKQFYDKNEKNITIDLVDYVWDINNTCNPSYEENKILKCCIVNDYGLITKSRHLISKSKFYNIPFIKVM